ncbi:hypothetical protein LSAT2_016912 [Lamellibrachia satsuma]|nr:hypothetical protein LSAT2_016912 [Lamellibrachia satsuma]
MLKTTSRFCKACRSFRQFRTLLSSRTYTVSVGTQSADHREEQDDREGESDPEEPTWEEFDDPLPEGSAYDQVYPGHIPSTLFQKSLLSVGTAFVAITAPWRGDSIATLGETTGFVALKYTRQKMLQNPVGKQILENLTSNALDASPGLSVTLMTPTKTDASPGLSVTLMTPTKTAASPGLSVTLMTPTKTDASPGLSVTLMTPTKTAASPGLSVTLMTPTKTDASPGLSVTLMTPTKTAASPGLSVTLMTPTKTDASPGLSVTLMTPTKTAASPGLSVTLMTPTKTDASPGLSVTLDDSYKDCCQSWPVSHSDDSYKD